MTFKKSLIFFAIHILGFGSFSYGMDKRVIEINLPRYTQEHVNEIVAEVGSQAYQTINTHWSYAANKKDISLNDNNWTINYQSTYPVYTYNWTSKTDEIVKDFATLLTTPFKTECMLVARTVQIACLIKLIGDNNFKKLAKNFLSPLRCVQLFVSKKSPEKRIESGDFVSLKNIYAYKYLKPNGNHSGQNILCTAEDQFIGFDKEFFEVPKSEAEIVEDFYNNVKSKDHLDGRLEDKHNQFVTCVVKDLDSFIQYRINEENHLPANIEFFDALKINDFLNQVFQQTK